MPKEAAVNDAVYRCLQLLGRGKGGYSYLAESGDGRQVVLKQLHHEPCSYYVFGDKFAAEMRDYQTLQETGILMPDLIEADAGRERLIKAYVPGPTVFELVAEDILPEACVTQVLEMCRLLYPAGLNIDYFPTNFVWNGGQLYYVDYECNPYSDEWNFENWGRKYWSRTPEFLEHAARLEVEMAAQQSGIWGPDGAGPVNGGQQQNGDR